MTDAIGRFQQNLLKTAARFSFVGELRTIAERLREEALAELSRNGEDCEEKQRLMSSLRIESGASQNEVQLVADGNYGAILEFGTRNSSESPWLIPALAKVDASIRTCLHDALKRALM